MAEVEHAPTATHSDDATCAVARGVRRVVYLSLAGLFFGFAVLGAFLPVLPTTPFLLLTSYFLARSSPRLNALLGRSRIFGPLLRDWNERGGVRPGVKWTATLVVLIVVGCTVTFALESTPPRVGVLLLAAVGLCVVWRLPVAADRAEATGVTNVRVPMPNDH